MRRSVTDMTAALQFDRRRWFLTAYVTFPIGSLRIRLPVAANTALHTAGAVGGTDGSPIPPSESVLGTMWTSTTGISYMRSTG